MQMAGLGLRFDPWLRAMGWLHAALLGSISCLGCHRAAGDVPFCWWARSSRRERDLSTATFLAHIAVPNPPSTTLPPYLLWGMWGQLCYAMRRALDTLRTERRGSKKKSTKRGHPQSEF